MEGRLARDGVATDSHADKKSQRHPVTHASNKKRHTDKIFNAKLFPWLLTDNPLERMKGLVDLTNPEAICTNKICITTLKQHA